MSNSIQLHPKHGLAPAILVCPQCGKDTNELALLGASADKVMKEYGKDGYQEYGSNKICSNNLCGSCQAILDNNGILIVAEDIKQSLLLDQDMITTLKEKIGKIIDFDKYLGQYVCVKKAFWYVDEEGNVRMRDPKEWLKQ